MLIHFALKIVGNYQEAEDIVSEAFLKLWEADGGEYPKTFLSRVVKNKCIDYLRHKITVEEADIKIEEFVDAKEILSDLVELYVKRIEQMPPMRRKIFKMIFFDELKTSEIAYLLNISVNTVRVQKAEALDFLRKTIIS